MEYLHSNVPVNDGFVHHQKPVNSPRLQSIQVNDLNDLIRQIHDAFNGDHVDVDLVSAILRAYRSNPADWKKFAKYDRYKFACRAVHQCDNFHTLAPLPPHLVLLPSSPFFHPPPLILLPSSPFFHPPPLILLPSSPFFHPPPLILLHSSPFFHPPPLILLPLSSSPYLPPLIFLPLSSSPYPPLLILLSLSSSPYSSFLILLSLSSSAYPPLLILLSLSSSPHLPFRPPPLHCSIHSCSSFTTL
ncbi:Cysteine dioxygenase type I [Trinorchestia longiramus]|nr:Cysteine dioxygenase type I [Trinorchestia longiramus]